MNDFKNSPIVHIGYPKTGTTWLIKNYYCKLNNIYFLPSKKVIELFFNHEKLIIDYERIKSQIDIHNVDKERVLICNHGFIGTNHSFGLKTYLTRENALRLKKIFPDCNIVITIRNQVDIIASTYMQYIRVGGTYSIDKFLNPDRFTFLKNTSDFYYTYFEYDEVIKFYKTLFGDDKVFVYLNEDFANDIMTFLKQLNETFNLSLNTADINLNKINRSPGRFILMIMRFRNRFTNKNIDKKNYILHIPGLFWISRILFNQLKKYNLTGKPPSSIKILGKKNYNQICNYYKESNRKLISEHNLKGIQLHNYPL
jgi:hypothetical protein